MGRMASLRCCCAAVWCVLFATPADSACLRVFADSFGPETTAAAEDLACRARRLNDSGVLLCTTFPGAAGSCDGSQPPEQDALHGRDAAFVAGQLFKRGSGDAGFDFTKIANDGRELAADAALGPAPEDWACTRDNVTGLLWEIKVVGDPQHPRDASHRYTWHDPQSGYGGAGVVGDTASCAGTLGAQACNTSAFAAAVSAAGLCGVGEWRMPYPDELANLAHHARAMPALDTGFVPQPSTNAEFWTASPVAGLPANAWVQSAATGATFAFVARSTPQAVRLVSGPRLTGTGACFGTLAADHPAGVYAAGPDGTVVDRRTGLMWKRCSEGQNWDGGFCSGAAASFTWMQAMAAAATSEHAGFTDWRLPNAKEMRSLVEHCRSGPAIDIAVFPATPNASYWTSTPSPGNAIWRVGFDLGTSDTGVATAVRLVRGSQ